MRIVLIDGGNLIHRLFHGMPYLCRQDGHPTSISKGFQLALCSIIDKFHPAVGLVAMDTRDPLTGLYRKCALWPAYKAHRKPPEADLLVQVPDCRVLAKAFGFQWIYSAGYEADDVIATAVVQAQIFENPEVIVVSGDSDLLPLAAFPWVRVVDSTDLNRVMTDKLIADKYKIPAAALPTYFALTGQSGDGYPGVPGIGPVAAAALVQAFGNMANILQAPAGSGGPVVAKALAKVHKHREQAAVMLEVATLWANVPGVTLRKRVPCSAKQVRQIFGELEFGLLSVEEETVYLQMEMV